MRTLARLGLDLEPVRGMAVRLGAEMPTKRRRLVPQRISVSAAAVEAWRAGDLDALRSALSIRPWQMLPWPLRLTALGCDRRHPPKESTPWARELVTSRVAAGGALSRRWPAAAETGTWRLSDARRARGASA